MTVFNDVQPGDLPGVMAQAQGGDAIKLVGDHPAVSIYGKRPATRIQIVGMPGASLKKTTIGNSTNLLFRTLKFQDVNPTPGSISGLVTAGTDSSNIGFDRCEFSTEDDVSGWTAQDWVNRPFNVGLFLRGVSMNAGGCVFKNLRNCVSIGGDSAILQNNSFSEFGNDAIQFGANWQQITGNVIRGGRHSPAEPGHADGAQGYPAPNGGIFSNLYFEDNDIEFVGPGDYLQGASIFDGWFKNLFFRRNRIKAEAYHALSLYGVDKVMIEDNTIEMTPSGKMPWIQVCKAKNGRVSSGVTIRNNTVPMIRCDVPDAVISNNVKADGVTPSAVTTQIAG